MDNNLSENKREMHSSFSSGEVIDSVAQKIVGLSLGGPAILLLSIFSPFQFIIHQGYKFFAPFLSIFTSNTKAESYEIILTDKSYYEKLIKRVEELEKL